MWCNHSVPLTYFPCAFVQKLLQSTMVDTKPFHTNRLLASLKMKPLPKPTNVMELVRLHHFPELKKQCCDLINAEWKRSETARMRTLESSTDHLPTNLVLLCGGTVIGHSKLSVVPSIEDACYLESVVIDKELRGRGYGKYMMEKVEEHCRSMGLRCIYLSTKDKAEFYDRLGYVRCAPISLYGQYMRSLHEGERIEKTAAAVCNNRGRAPGSSPQPPPPPPMPPAPKLPMDLYVGVNCGSKVYMAKVL